MLLILRMGIEWWGVIFCAILSIITCVQIKSFGIVPKLFTNMFLMEIILLLMDIGYHSNEGNRTVLGQVVIVLTNFLSYLIPYLMIWSGIFLTLALVEYNKGIRNQGVGILEFIKNHSNKWTLSVSIILSVNVVVLVVTQFTGFYYHISSDMIYIEGHGNLLSGMLCFAGIFINFLYVLTHRKLFDKIQFIFIILYAVLPLAAFSYTLFWKNYFVVYMAAIISLLFSVIAYIYKMNQFSLQQESQLIEASNKLLQAQMNPHFIFNSLTTIKSLCRKDSHLAIQAIDSLSSYLHNSMRFIGKSDLVAVEDELDLIDLYIEMVQYRIGDSIYFDYEIEDGGYQLPPISLQPLVENAIKHGIRKQMQTGKITVRLYQENRMHVIQVQDDGAGFDLNSTDKKKDRIHALEIIEARIDYMCNGKMRIDSKPGFGTTVEIQIPIK